MEHSNSTLEEKVQGLYGALKERGYTRTPNFANEKVKAIWSRKIYRSSENQHRHMYTMLFHEYEYEFKEMVLHSLEMKVQLRLPDESTINLETVGWDIRPGKTTVPAMMTQITKAEELVHNVFTHLNCLPKD